VYLVERKKEILREAWRAVFNRRWIKRKKKKRMKKLSTLNIVRPRLSSDLTHPLLLSSGVKHRSEFNKTVLRYYMELQDFGRMDIVSALR
jgi:hypothetical protein